MRTAVTKLADSWLRRASAAPAATVRERRPQPARPRSRARAMVVAWSVLCASAALVGVAGSAVPVAAADSGFVGVVPSRILDTRDGPGIGTVDGLASGGGAVGPAEAIDVVVAGRAGLPVSGIGAVVLNVTVTQPTSDSFVTVYPTGSPRPTTSNLNPGAGRTVANTVVVGVGTEGKVSIYQHLGSAHVVIDVLGWFSTSAAAAVRPVRLADTRDGFATVDGIAAGGGAMGMRTTARIPVLGRGGIPSSGVAAVVVNVTVVEPSATTYVSFGSTDGPVASVGGVDAEAGSVVPRLLVVPVGSDGGIAIDNRSGRVDVVVDLLAWLPRATDTTARDPIVTVRPSRLLETRAGSATVDGRSSGTEPIGAGRSVVVPVAGRGGVPLTDVGAVAVVLTGTNATLPTFVTAWPSGHERPNASTLNLVPSATTSNLTILPLGPDGSISVFNASGSADVLVDVVAWFPASTRPAPTFEAPPTPTIATPPTASTTPPPSNPSPAFLGVMDQVSVRPAIAFGLRRLDGRYRGPAIEVRRSGDDARRDIGFTEAGDLDIAALQAFVGSRSGFVTTWYDQSGNGRDLAQPVAANQPRIVNAGLIDTSAGRPTVQFLGGQFLGTTSPFAAGWTQFGVHGVFRNNGSAPFAGVISVLGNGATVDHDNTRSFRLLQHNNNPASIGLYRAGSYRAVAAITPHTSSIVSGWFDATNSNLGVNGATPGVAAYSAAALGNTVELRVGNSFSTTSDFLTGTVSEFALFGAAPATADRRSLERSQDTYYGVTPTPGTTSPAALPVAGAFRWFDAADPATVVRSGVAVTSWTDKGSSATPLSAFGTGADVTWNADGLAPGEPAVVTNAGRVLGTGAPANEAVTTFVVARTIGPSRGRVVSAYNNWLLGWWGGGEDAGHFNAWVTSNPPPASTDRPRLYSSTQTATSATVWRNGAQIATGTGSYRAPQGLSVGGYGVNNGDRSHAAISEIIVYPRVLTESERLGTESYLAQKWGITTTTTAPPVMARSPLRWFDASNPVSVVRSGESVVSWTDLGSNGTPLGVVGAGLDVTWDPDGLAPGEPAVITNAGKFLGTGAPQNDTVTAFVVARTNGPARSRVLSAYDNWLLGWWSGREDAAHFNAWVTPSSPPASTDRPRLYSSTQTSTSATVWRNGTQIATATSNFRAPQGLTVGGWGNGGERSNAAVSEIIIYQRELTDRERQQVEQYLIAKWGIA